MAGEIRIGTASWTDPGFISDWYPKELPSSARLNWYAEHFNLVEVNSSFYAIPNQRVVERWCEQTPPGFIFNVKLHRLLSRHSTTPDLLPPDLRRGATLKDGKIVLTPALEAAVIKRLLREIEPLAEHGKSGALLLQLSPAFSPKAHELSELDHLFGCLEGRSIAVELRSRDWLEGERRATTLEFFAKRKISFVSVDAPREPHFTILPSDDIVTNPQLAYLRCHGRNFQGYIKGRTVAERFNYSYSEDELQELAGRSAKLAEQSAMVHVIYNNNRSNYAPVNAAQLREILEMKRPAVSTGPKPSRAENLELKLDR